MTPAEFARALVAGHGRALQPSMALGGGDDSAHSYP